MNGHRQPHLDTRPHARTHARTHTHAHTHTHTHTHTHARGHKDIDTWRHMLLQGWAAGTLKLLDVDSVWNVCISLSRISY
jgi:hypothetical protein